MSQRTALNRVGAALVLIAGMSLASCGRSNPSAGPDAATKAADRDGGGHNHGKDADAAHNHSGWWCVEHGVPEAECSQCNSKVAAAFQKKGDWCKEHDRAQSQCFLCDPKAKERYGAIFKAKYGTDPPAT